MFLIPFQALIHLPDVLPDLMEVLHPFRAARGFLIGDGTPDIQKLIISRNLFGRDFAP
jgi:hypothetical protein